MPKKYLEIRDTLAAKGKPMSEAKAIAAAIYNKTRKPGQRPVTRSTK